MVAANGEVLICRSNRTTYFRSSAMRPGTGPLFADPGCVYGGVSGGFHNIMAHIIGHFYRIYTQNMSVVNKYEV